MATVFEGFTAFTLGLKEISSCISSDLLSAFTTTLILDNCDRLVVSNDLSSMIYY
jgi:hypothetical protein